MCFRRSVVLGFATVNPPCPVPAGQLCTVVRVAERKVPIGQLTPADIVAKVNEACTDAGCATAPISISTKVWEAATHTPGSTYNRKCDLIADTGYAYQCGYWADGTCTVSFDGSYTPKARARLMPRRSLGRATTLTLLRQLPPPCQVWDRRWAR